MISMSASTSTGARPSDISSMSSMLRTRHERAGDRDLLLLAAGEQSGEIGRSARARRGSIVRTLFEIGIDLTVGAQIRAHAQVVFDRQRSEEPSSLRYLHHAGALTTRSGSSPVSVRVTVAMPFRSRSSTSPLIAPSSVDFPAPFEPMSATISPGSMRSDTSQSTCVSP